LYYYIKENILLNLNKTWFIGKIMVHIKKEMGYFRAKKTLLT